MLRILLVDPRRAYYQRQLEGATGLPIRAVQRELARMTGMGLLYRHTEGNRAYYQVDPDFPLFPELRRMVLKLCGAVDALRGVLATTEGVRLAFLSSAGDRALAVAQPGSRLDVGSTEIPVQTMKSKAFLSRLLEKDETLDAYLREGVDLLGRRDDVIWRRIEAAGYDVSKGAGVP